MLRISPQVPLERRSRRPPRDGAADCSPRRDDNVDSSVGIRVLGFRVGCQVAIFTRPVRILPYDERFVERVEAVADLGGCADGEGFLIAFRVCEIQCQSVRDPAFFLERLDDAVDEVVSHAFFSVREYHVYVAAFGLATAVAANDYCLDVGVCDEFRVVGDGGGDGFDFRAGDFQEELVVVFETYLLDAGERFPAIFNNVIEVAPAFVVVELTCCLRTDAPYFVKFAENFEGRVRLEVCNSANLTIVGLPFVKEMGYLLVAPRQGEDLRCSSDGVRIGCQGSNARTVCTDTNLVQSQETG